MGRHSLPDRARAGATGPRPWARRRGAAVAAALLLGVVGGTAAAVNGGLPYFGSSCDDGTVRLNVAASPDIAPVLEATAGLARERNITSDGRCLDVRVVARESFEVADGLRADGADGVDAWVPDSTAWLQRVQTDSTAVRLDQIGNIASSPLGVAAVPSAARTLGWPKRTYTWTELAGTALQDDRLRLGTADPARSATGLLALTRLAGGQGGGTATAALAKQLSRRTVDADDQVVTTLPRDASGTEQGNPKRNRALFLSERSAFAYNGSVNADDRLRFFYPKDGSPRLDYPLVLVDGARLTTDRSRAALRLLTLLDSPDSRELLARRGFRPADGSAPRALVSRAGGRAPQPFAGDPPETDSSRELRETLGLWTITVQSARITTVVDTSASMDQPVPGTDRSRMDVTKASLRRALSDFNEEDEIGLWQFSRRLDGKRDYRILVPTGRLGDRLGDDSQHDLLDEAFRKLKPVPEGSTGLYDTTLAAYREAVSSYAEGKFNALVVLTDGVNEDPGSISRGDLLTALEAAVDPDRPVALIAVGVGPEADRKDLHGIARAAGGSGHEVSDPGEIQSVILSAITEAGTRS